MRTCNKRELAIIWLDSFLGIENEQKQQIFSVLDGKSNLKSLIEDKSEFIVSLIGIDKYKTLVNSANKEYLDSVLEDLDRKGVDVITVVSDNYPEFLSEIDEPPLVLYCKGNEKLLSEEIFGIVGSRKSLPLSINIAKEYSSALINAGFTLITGIAEGIDQTVIETAVKEKGKIISVIAGGFSNIYPASNSNLVEEIIDGGGLVISEQPPSVVPKPFLFPKRNRIISALSVGVLIVNGGMKSGVHHTARYAGDYGKDLFAVPYSIGIKSGEGSNEIIKKGAMLTDSPQDILNFYNKEIENKKKKSYSEEELEIINALSENEKHIDLICNELGKPVFKIMPTITMLEMKGEIVKIGVNIYGLAKKSED